MANDTDNTRPSPPSPPSCSGVTRSAIIQNHSSGNPRTSVWEKIRLAPAMVGAETVDTLFRHGLARNLFFSGRLPQAYRLAKELPNPSDSEKAIVLEALATGEMEFSEFTEAGVGLADSMPVALLNSVFRWFRTRLSDGRSASVDKSIGDYAHLLQKVWKQGTTSPDTRRHIEDMADSIHALLRRQIPKAFERHRHLLPQELDRNTSPAVANRGPNALQNSVRAYFMVVTGKEPELDRPEYTLLQEMLTQLDLFERGIRNPEISAYSDLAVILRDLYETLINLRFKIDFLNHLQERGEIDSYNRSCDGKCKGQQADLCKALSFVTNKERNLRPGEWLSVLKSMQACGGDEGITCKRGQVFVEFLRSQHWDRCFLHTSFLNKTEAIIETGLLSKLVHCPRPGRATYDSLTEAFESLTGLSLSHWRLSHLNFDRFVDRTALFPLIMEPRHWNAMV